MDTSVIEYAAPVSAKYDVPRCDEWNGNPDDRAAALARLDRVLQMGGVLAAVWTGDRTATHVRSVVEVEQIEQELGHVEVTVTPQVRGG